MATPIPYGSELLINTATAAGQVQPAVTALANGRFLLAWADYSETGADTAFSAVRVQMMNADGTKAGAAVLINTTTNGYQDQPAITALADGRYVVTWTDTSASGGDTTGFAIRAQVMNANGTKSGAEVLINTITAGNQSLPEITALADGRYVVTWQDFSQSSGDTAGFAIRAQVMNANGTKSGAEVLINTATGNNQFEPDIAALADGSYVVVWTDESGTGGDTAAGAIRAQVMNANGTKIGGEILINTTTVNDQFKPAVTALADGRFVVAWTDFSLSPDDTSNTAIRAQVMNANGTKSGGEVLINTITASAQTEPAITALADGRYVVTWQDASASVGDTTGTAIRAQVMNTDGTKSGTEFLVNTTTPNDQLEPVVTALADGRFVISWTDGSESGGDTSGLAIRARVFDPREAAVSFSGTAAADQFVGTVFADTLSGAGGNDRLTGWLGKDSISGAAGNDLLAGGDGADKLYGGAGADTVTGNAGADQLYGGNGNDKLRGGAAADTLSGGSGADDFIFASTAEAKGDRISGFVHLSDDIDLRPFMNNGQFIGAAAFTGAQDDVRYVKATGVLSGDVNGDGAADWSLTIANKPVLTAADFIF